MDLQLPYRLPKAIAGMKVFGPGGQSGRLGILALTSQQGVVGITAASLLNGQGNATLTSLDQVNGAIALDGSCRLREEEGHEFAIAALLCTVPLVGKLEVRSDFAGLEEMPPPVPAARNVPYFLIRGTDLVELGSVVSTDGTVYRESERGRSVVYGATRIDARRAALTSGDAGTAICDSQRRPLGMLVGAEADLAIVAPLSHAFRTARLRPLSIFEASRHFDLALQKARAQYPDQLIAAEQREVKKRAQQIELTVPEIDIEDEVSAVLERLG